VLLILFVKRDIFPGVSFPTAAGAKVERRGNRRIISEQQLNYIGQSLPWVADLVTQEGVIQIQYHGGPNDLVTEQVLDLIQSLERDSLQAENATIKCSAFEV